MKGSFSPFSVPSYRISSLDGSTASVEYFSMGLQNWKSPRNFHRGKQILSVFLYGAMYDTVSGLVHFKETALPIWPANADWLKKVKRYLQLIAFFLMTLQLPRILSLLTGKGFILRARWRLITPTKRPSAATLEHQEGEWFYCRLFRFLVAHSLKVIVVGSVEDDCMQTLIS